MICEIRPNHLIQRVFLNTLKPLPFKANPCICRIFSPLREKNISIKKYFPESSLLLKSLPPNLTQGFVSRERLNWSNFNTLREQIAILSAPTGFGKTSQLVQWKRDASALGTLTIWFSVDKNDQPLRFVRGLTYAAAAVCETYGFNNEAVQWIDNCNNPSEAITAWLAEIAFISMDVLLILDDGDQMPSESLQSVLPYIAENAPANLRVGISAKPSSDLVSSGMLSPEKRILINASELRFQLQDTLTALNRSLNQQCPPELVAHLHELTEGWPLGVQLAATAIRNGGDPDSLKAQASSDLRRYFVESVIDRLPEESVEMLIRLAKFDLLHPDFCIAVLNSDTANQDIVRLSNETPLFLKGERDNWIRFHPFAKKILRERTAKLDQAEQIELSTKASKWFATRELYEEAAEHAFQAGNSSAALELIDRGKQAMTARGRSNAVLSWYERINAEELVQHPDFWAPVGWALATSERHEEAAPIVQMIINKPDLTTAEHFEAAMIKSSAATFADRFDLLSEVIDQWQEMPKDSNSDMEPIYLLASANCALFRGDPDKARIVLDRAKHFDYRENYAPVSWGFVNYIEGLSYLWAGRYELARQNLQPVLERAEVEMGRRNHVTCMIASLLAYAHWETGSDDQAALLLADRLTVIDYRGLPESIIGAYKLQARMADKKEGRQDKALSILDSFHAIGRKRKQVRLQVIALTEMIRLHARHSRVETARSISVELKTLWERSKATTQTHTNNWIQLHVELTLALVELAIDTGESNRQAIVYARSAAKIASDLKRSADQVEAWFIIMEAEERLGTANQQTEVKDAFSLAEANNMRRLIQDYQHLNPNKDKAENDLQSIQSNTVIAEPKIEITDNVLLTPKEKEVLILLSRNLSNKEIARAMDISIETVKWHIKNLSGKLHAGNRKHAVARAKILGLFKEQS